MSSEYKQDTFDFIFPTPENMFSKVNSDGVNIYLKDKYRIEIKEIINKDILEYTISLYIIKGGVCWTIRRYTLENTYRWFKLEFGDYKEEFKQWYESTMNIIKKSILDMENKSK